MPIARNLPLQYKEVIIATSLKLDDTDGSNYLNLDWNEDDSSDRNLYIKVHGDSRALDLGGDLVLSDDNRVESWYFSDGTDIHVIKGVAETGLGGRLTVGLDETARTMVVCDYGDIGTDFGLSAASDPTFLLYDKDGTYRLLLESKKVESNESLTIRGSFLNYELLANLNAGDAHTFGGIYELREDDAEQAFMKLEPIVKQTSTAGYVGFLMDVTETSKGSGTNELMALRIGGNDRVTISNDSAKLTLIHSDNTQNVSLKYNALDFRTCSGISYLYSSTGGMVFAQGADMASGDAFTFTQSAASKELTASSGEQAFIKISPEILQTSTANYVGILFDVTESSVGSGTDKLLDFRKAGSTYCEIYWSSGYPILRISDASPAYSVALRYNQLYPTGAFTYLHAGTAVFTQNADLAAGNQFTFNSAGTAELTDSDAEQAFIAIEPEILQTDTANYVAVLVDVTESSVGSGQDYLLDLRLATATKFRVLSDGTVDLSGQTITTVNANGSVDLTTWCDTVVGADGSDDEDPKYALLMKVAGTDYYVPCFTAV